MVFQEDNSNSNFNYSNDNKNLAQSSPKDKNLSDSKNQSRGILPVLPNN
jgi:hypothetical protein